MLFVLWLGRLWFMWMLIGVVLFGICYVLEVVNKAVYTLKWSFWCLSHVFRIKMLLNT